MIEIIAAYAAGIATGAGLLILNRKSVEKALKQQKKQHDTELARVRATRTSALRENAELKQEIDIMERTRDCNDAYRHGVQARKPQRDVSDAERFARTFEGKRAEFKGVKAAG